ncbi:PREDICTED: cationic amino acid transporter 2-like [Papilio xuthus]|uniref:Cationic amino acid transporter 2-like n=1 Tax=Papilio xuthus TaxID=66420 RepID=A0AAJ7E5W5_PAPXU|nr:PREDICTED: cationic amino acid transporter 2-like [Papilio xuthus]
MAGGRWRAFGRALARKRVFEPDQLEVSNLRRCLTIWDLTALGVGSTLGVGVYVLVGSVALHFAGPSIILSFLIAAVASLFAGMCYAEFGSRVPKAGSAYIYTYVAVGEFVAFIIGWNMILEGVFGTASVARGLSLYLDSMTNKSMSGWFLQAAPIYSPQFSPYFDLFSFLVVLVLGAVLSLGARESSAVNKVLAASNMLVILFIVIAGAFKADSRNWAIPGSEVPDGHGSGGFFPYGAGGTLRGAAVCFYGFVGFDTINSTGEEVREPRRAIPVAILTVLSIVFAAYASVSVVITMMVPYYLQDTVASVATAFTFVGWDWARWVVSVGAVFGISASLFGSMFPLPRLLYSMASDGLLCHWFAHVTSKRKSPVLATILPSCVIAVLAAIVELEQLVMMMCIGTLLSYTIVAACVILLRYRPTPLRNEENTVQSGCCNRKSTLCTSRLVNTTLILYICICLSTALVGSYVAEPLVPILVLHGVGLALMIVIIIQPQADEDLPFKTPLVPVVPCLSIYANIHLMILINVQTWIRVIIWIAIGIPVYFICTCYYKKMGRRSSSEDKPPTKLNKNGGPPVKIIIETPTPPDTIKISSSRGGDLSINSTIKSSVVGTPVEEKVVRNYIPFVTEEIIVQQAIMEDNDEREAKIIDLLDQVLQAEEDSYEEIITLQEPQSEEKDNTAMTVDVHRKSLSELSDAGSDASLGNQVLSKYDVIALVHREDLPKLTEEEEKNDRDDTDQNDDYEYITEINESETNSRTDESGYSDTLDKNTLSESVEDNRIQAPVIPVPPPMDENLFSNPSFKKSYTISSRPSKARLFPEPPKEKPRLSIQSNGSIDEAPMVFGSDKQMNFMSKLNNIFQTKMSSVNDGDELRKRSHSAGNLADNAEYSLSHERPPIYFDLKKEIEARNLKEVREPKKTGKDTVDDRTEPKKNDPDSDDDEDMSLSREDLKSKLESIFAAGGPRLVKPRVMESNPPTPEEPYSWSAENISRIPKVEKNDTLKRQKAKFNEVLNSIRLSINKSDNV